MYTCNGLLTAAADAVLFSNGVRERSGGDMKYQALVDGRAGDHELLLGNEAAVRGALEAGIGVAASYPGTPSSEIGDVFSVVAKASGVYFEYSANEKVALEVAAACGRKWCSVLHVHEACRTERCFGFLHDDGIHRDQGGIRRAFRRRSIDTLVAERTGQQVLRAPCECAHAGAIESAGNQGLHGRGLRHFGATGAPGSFPNDDACCAHAWRCCFRRSKAGRAARRL